MTAAERLANNPQSELWGEHRARYRFAAQFAVSGTTVLDVASGSGFGLEMLRHTGADVIGLDYDGAALYGVRRLLGDARLVHGDATRLPLRAAVIDTVVSFETLEHVPDAAAMVRELRRVLKPGGRLILSTPNKSFGPPRLHANNPYHIQEFTAAELRTLLSASFSTVTLYGQAPSSKYRYVPFLMVDRHIEPRALTWKIQTRLPYALRDTIALSVSGRSFYPSEHDYEFTPEDWERAHALIAVAE
ncbi:MAG: hypothetical protein NVSMB2_19920 [Chloroflexota bacterium]